MNAPVTIVAVDDFGVATNAVNTWRGRCLHSFTRAEVVVTETLAVLAQATSNVLLPHLVGQRFEILAEALRKSGDAPAALEAVEAFRAHGELRNMLCHGDCKVTIDRNGGWQATFTMITLRRGAVERRFLVIDPEEAKAVAHMLSRDQQRLVTQLARLVPPASYVGHDRVLWRTGMLSA